MKEVKVIGVSLVPRKNEYYIHLANKQKIRVDKTEYQKMKRRLSGKSEVYIDVEVEE